MNAPVTRAAGLALLMLFTLPLAAADGPATTEDGLERIQVKNVDRVYKRPGASLKGYTSIMIRPVSVAFSGRWNPRDFGLFGLKDQEVERIRTELSKLARDTFTRVLSKGGYPVASAAGANVLDVEAEIIDLYVNAPEVNDSAVRRSYVFSAGDMRLLLTLRDSVTGTTLYRASDFKRGDDYGRLEWANDVFNRAEAERALEGWARQLKNALDAAKGS